MPSVSVGNHAYSLSGSGWGSEFTYVHKNLTAEIGYYDQGNNLLNAASFATNPGTQHTTSMLVAYSNPSQPLEVGIYQSNGSFDQTTAPGAIDIFRGTGIYLQRDARPHGLVGTPGGAVIYQVTADTNPGKAGAVQRPPGSSSSVGFQIEEPFFNGGAMFGVRKEIINSLGTISNATALDAGFQVPHLPYLFVYTEATMGSYTTNTLGRPTWRWAMRWAGPVRGPVNRIK